MLIVQEICAQYGYVIDEMQSHVNQLHFLLDISPPISAVEIIHKNKQISTFQIYKKHLAFFEKTLLEGKIRSDLIGILFAQRAMRVSKRPKKYIAQQG